MKTVEKEVWECLSCNYSWKVPRKGTKTEKWQRMVCPSCLNYTTVLWTKTTEIEYDNSSSDTEITNK